MPRVYKTGDRVGGYIIEREINRGLTAFSYQARDRDGPVFLKQYRSPTVRVPWYRRYLEYQRELRERIESGSCRNFCYRFLRAFEFDRCYFQSFEYLDRSDSMEELLERCRDGRRQVTGEQRLIMAKVLIGGIHALHLSGVVHSDLKPANVMLIRDKSIVAGYRLKIIDMDFSLLQDRPAPWHGERGYFGTPGYLSPEHLRGQIPCPASDVFTLGLMLCELLGEGHPYRFEDDTGYREAVLGGTAGVPRLLGEVARRIEGDEVPVLIRRCLSPDPADRPTAEALAKALNNRKTLEAPVPMAPATDEPLWMVEFEPDEPADPPSGRAILGGLRLCSAAGVERTFNITTPVGRMLLRQFGPESRFADERQFQLERTASGWLLIPQPGTANDTMLNGKRLRRPALLSEGDTVGIGRESKGIVKLPLTVRSG